MSRLSRFALLLLAIEFLDELTFGAREAAWPLLRSDLDLSYLQVGALISLPLLASNIIEPLLAILGNTWRRRALILGGGCLFAGVLAAVALSASFLPLLVAFALLAPASGAFVSLSQATLMDIQPERREVNMARWTFAGSLGVLLGPLCLGLASWLGWGWRGLFLAFAILAGGLTVTTWREPFPVVAGQLFPDASALTALRDGLREAWRVMRRRHAARWLVLLQFSDLMLDVLLGFLALYFVEAAQVTPAQASLAVAVWSGAGLLGDFLIIPLLERVPGLRYLRWSVLLELVLFPVFLLAPGFTAKLVVLGLLGLFNAGWYAILQAQLYAALPGRSGTALAASNLAGAVGALLPLGVSLVAQRYNLQAAMWLLLLGPVALWFGLPPSGYKTQ
ncbi:MAG: MFS transporter [Anaerolineales bacterium]|nr:MFS transporter [Anaerolineales bacterium]